MLLYPQLRSLQQALNYWPDAAVAPDAAVVFADSAEAFAVIAGLAEVSVVSVDPAAVFADAAVRPAVAVSAVIADLAAVSAGTAVPVQASAAVRPVAVASVVIAEVSADTVVPVQAFAAVAVVAAAAAASAETVAVVAAAASAKTVEPVLLSDCLLPALMSLHFSQELQASYPAPAPLASCRYYLLAEQYQSPPECSCDCAHLF